MEFNRITRGSARAAGDEEIMYSIMYAGSLCHKALVHEVKAVMIPKALGLKNDYIYFHGSATNTPFIQI